MQSNKLLAAESHNATKNMEHMTRDMRHMTQDMNEVARKTKTETVSMKIITLVTLFFLPGTFISVGCFFFLFMVSSPLDGHISRSTYMAFIQVLTSIYWC